MRISDWSSDVCSSDLLWHPRLGLAGRGAGHGRAGHAFRPRPDGGGAALSGGARMGDDGRRHIMATDEAGAASGRGAEGACPRVAGGDGMSERPILVLDEGKTSTRAMPYAQDGRLLSTGETTSERKPRM